MNQMTFFSSPAPRTFAHERILASAGSGKTYQLTNRYLQLVHAGAKPESILASTFTRLAAGEIRNRILGRLAAAVDDDEKRKELAESLDVKLDRDEVLVLLRRLTRRLHVMQVRTLDSFFASVVRGFALELGVPPGCSILEENEAEGLRAEAMRRLLDEQDPQALVELLRLLTQGQSERIVMATIDRTVRELYVIYPETDAEAWATLPLLPGELAPPALVTAIQDLESPDLMRVAKAVKDKRFGTAHAESCEEARGHRWDDFIRGGIAQKVLQEEAEYYGKEIPPELIDAYRPVLGHAASVLVRLLREQAIASHALLGLFDAAYSRIKRQRHVLTFEDLRTTLDRAEQLAPLGDISYRIDASIEHMLLDEFQDTSVPQWRVLESIARELVADETTGRSFFCVGDVKQSIYGWRDAEPEVLHRLPTLLFGEGGEDALGGEPLTKSWRSAQPIIDVVNRVFGSLGKNEAMRDYGPVSESWADLFAEHSTEHTERPGYVELRTGPKRGPKGETDKQYDRRRLQAAAQLVAELHRRAPDRTIGILTRTNVAVSRLLYELGPTGLGVRVSGRGGGPLTDAPAVNAILDLLELADHPDDTIAAFNVAHSPLAAVVGSGPDLVGSKPERVRVSRAVRRSLAERGYAETLAGWTAAIASACDERELRRVVQLIELAETYDPRASARTSDFIRLVETREVADTFPAPVQVMTVHQSKGLEYDIVVLPELDGFLRGSKNPTVVIEREGVAGRITRVCRNMNEQLRGLIPVEAGVEAMFEAHKLKAVRESLCLLYVAMTRAREGLHMMNSAPKAEKTSFPKTTAGVLRSALIDRKPAPDSIVYAHGDPDYLAVASDRPRREPVPSTASTGTITLPSPRGAIPRGQPAPPASDHRQGARLGEQLRVPDRDARDHGSAIHAMFEQIEWLDEWRPDAAALAKIALAAAPTRDEAWARGQVRDFLGIIERPGVRDALSRDEEHRASTRVFREQPYVLIKDDGTVQQGKIDRIVVAFEGGRACRAAILDFKTDRVEDDAAIDRRAEHYRRQLESYRTAAARMYGLDPATITMKLVFVRPGIVRDL